MATWEVCTGAFHCKTAAYVLVFNGTFLWLLQAFCGLIQRNIHLSLLQAVNRQNSSVWKYIRHNLVADVVFQNLTTGREVGCFHCILCRFISGWKWWAEASSIVTYRRINLTALTTIVYCQNHLMQTKFNHTLGLSLGVTENRLKEMSLKCLQKDFGWMNKGKCYKVV